MNVLLLDTNVVSILFNRNHSLRQTCIEAVTDRLRKAEIVIDVQKKVAMLLGIPIAETEVS